LTLLVLWLVHGWLAALVTSLVLLTAPHLNATTRHAVWRVVLTCIVLVPLAILAWPAPTPTLLSTTLTAVDAAGPRWALSLPALPLWLPAALAALWGLRASFCGIRLVRSLIALRRWRARCLPFDVARERRLPHWRAERRGGRHVTLAVSVDLGMPSVLGLWSPVIAIPEALTHAATDEEIDMIVLHELAHVRRRDDYERLVETLVRAVAGFHPGIRHCLRALDLEREAACDEWVAERTREPKQYARCLTAVAAWARDHADASLAPALWSARASVPLRIHRLIEPNRRFSTRIARGRLLTTLAALTAIVAVGVAISPRVIIEVASGESSAIIPSAIPRSARTPPGAGFVVADMNVPAPPSPVSTEFRGVSSKFRDVSRRLAPPRPAVQPAAPEPTNVAAASVSPPLVRRRLSTDTFRTPPALSAGGLASGPSSEIPEPETPAILQSPSPWKRTATAGAAVGTAAAKAGQATGGFFRRAASSIAQAF
jgi:beta-lactamase regulating signal transducer with metallopeptidase domain